MLLKIGLRSSISLSSKLLMHVVEFLPIGIILKRLLLSAICRAQYAY